MIKRTFQRGSVLVEFSLVLPLFLMIVFGMVEFGFAIHDKNIITQAARVGARAGILLRPALDSDGKIIAPQLGDAVNIATTRTQNYCAGNLISLGSGATNCRAEVSANSLLADAPFTVTASYTYQGLLLGRLLGLTGNSISMSSSVTMYRE
jgi:Flp pilus assembly protein TadG